MPAPRTKENVPAGRPRLLDGAGDRAGDEVAGAAGGRGGPSRRPGSRRRAPRRCRRRRWRRRAGSCWRRRPRPGRAAPSRWRMSARGSGARSGSAGSIRTPRWSPLADDAGEHPQLAGGAADLAGDAALGQAALARRPRSMIASLSASISAATASRKCAALLGGGGAVGGERLGCGRGGGGDVGLLGVGAGDDRGGVVSHGFLSVAACGGRGAQAFEPATLSTRVAELVELGVGAGPTAAGGPGRPGGRRRSRPALTIDTA